MRMVRSTAQPIEERARGSRRSLPAPSAPRSYAGRPRSITTGARSRPWRAGGSRGGGRGGPPSCPGSAPMPTRAPGYASRWAATAAWVSADASPMRRWTGCTTTSSTTASPCRSWTSVSRATGAPCRCGDPDRGAVRDGQFPLDVDGPRDELDVGGAPVVGRVAVGVAVEDGRGVPPPFHLGWGRVGDGGRVRRWTRARRPPGSARRGRSSSRTVVGWTAAPSRSAAATRSASGEGDSTRGVRRAAASPTAPGGGGPRRGRSCPRNRSAHRARSSGPGTSTRSRVLPSR